MKVECVDDPELIARLGQSGSFGQRSEGLHVSEIYKRLMVRLQPKKYGKPIDDPARKRMEIGILFENILEQALRDKYGTERVGEIFSKEGIAMSPDGVNPTLVCGEEYKATLKKCPDNAVLTDADGQPLMDFYVWFVQMKAYAKHLELLDWRLYVCWIRGDYKYGDDCVYPPGHIQPYAVSFSEEEVEDNWRMLIRIAREEGLL